ITEFFTSPGPPSRLLIPSEFSGTMSVVASNPISILGLRLSGQNIVAIPLINVTQLNFPIPVLSLGVGGLGAELFPQFILGGGWASDITVLNSSPSDLTVRLDVFAQDGTPLAVTLGGRTASSFTNLLVPGNGRLVIGP